MQYCREMRVSPGVSLRSPPLLLVASVSLKLAERVPIVENETRERPETFGTNYANTMFGNHVTGSHRVDTQRCVAFTRKHAKKIAALIGMILLITFIIWLNEQLIQLEGNEDEETGARRLTTQAHSTSASAATTSAGEWIKTLVNRTDS